MLSFNLSRLQITGNLTSQTPLSVLTEIADAHGIPYRSEYLDRPEYHRELIRLIESSRIVSVQEPYDQRSYQYIARFVNHRCDWQKAELDQAFAFLRRYLSRGELPADDFEIGPQTPEKPRSFNGCLLYKLCRQYNIIVNPSTTLQQMALSLRFFLQPMDFLSQLLTRRLDQLTRENLVNMLSFLPDLEGSLPSSSSNSEENFVGYTQLETIYTTLRNTHNLYRRIEPQNSGEAIVLAAMMYKIDLTKFNSPLTEYRELSSEIYIPTDPLLRRIVLKNPNFLRLDYNFNPLLPVGLYTNDDLRRMAIAEGYKSIDFSGSDYYELLQLAYLSYTFYPGLQDQVSNRRTPITYDNLDELDNQVILCFGSKNSGGLIAFRYSELAESFRINKNFLNPIANQTSFEDLAIRKLKILAHEFHPDQSPDAREEKLNLYNAIIETEIFTEENNLHLREFYQLYTSSEDSEKQAIRDIFRLILEIGMYMRGWSGEGIYPIIQAPYQDQDLVDERVSNALRRFEEACLQFPLLGDQIKHLPLFYYRDGFIPSTDHNQGITLDDRLELIRSGNTTTNINSCIRMSSNWICYSAYRYMQIVGMDPPFPLEALQNIT